MDWNYRLIGNKFQGDQLFDCNSFQTYRSCTIRTKSTFWTILCRVILFEIPWSWYYQRCWISWQNLFLLKALSFSSNYQKLESLLRMKFLVKDFEFYQLLLGILLTAYQYHTRTLSTTDRKVRNVHLHEIMIPVDRWLFPTNSCPKNNLSFSYFEMKDIRTSQTTSIRRGSRPQYEERPWASWQRNRLGSYQIRQRPLWRHIRSVWTSSTDKPKKHLLELIVVNDYRSAVAGRQPAIVLFRCSLATKAAGNQRTKSVSGESIPGATERRPAHPWCRKPVGSAIDYAWKTPRR